MEWNGMEWAMLTWVFKVGVDNPTSRLPDHKGGIKHIGDGAFLVVIPFLMRSVQEVAEEQILALTQCKHTTKEKSMNFIVAVVGH